MLISRPSIHFYTLRRKQTIQSIFLFFKVTKIVIRKFSSDVWYHHVRIISVHDLPWFKYILIIGYDGWLGTWGTLATVGCHTIFYATGGCCSLQGAAVPMATRPWPTFEGSKIFQLRWDKICWTKIWTSHAFGKLKPFKKPVFFGMDYTPEV